MSEAIEFVAEQRALAARCWQLVGLRDELAAPNAWIRRTVFGTDIFIQNFAGELRGFHNVCAHRGFPLRREPRGVGAVQCGFHGWVYNRDGVPTGIPRNAELFQISREGQRERALAPVRVEAIGRFVFASLAPASATASLADYLGAYADVVRAIDGELGELLVHESSPLAAGWQTHVEISLDDYHLATVHPTTFGAAEPAVHQFVYRRDGAHSCYLKRRDPEWSFDGFWRDVTRGAYDRTGYKIFNLFPNFLVTTTPDAAIASSVTALDATHSVVDNYVLGWRAANISDDARSAIATYFTTVFAEDRHVCEQWQSTYDPRARRTLGRLEQRVGWFRDAYDAVLASHRERR